MRGPRFRQFASARREIMAAPRARALRPRLIVGRPSMARGVFFGIHYARRRADRSDRRPAMPRDIPSLRILPMSERMEGFRGRSIEDVQRNVFLRWLPAHAGRWRYPRAGVNAPHGTIVLFQFRARIIASAALVRDERFPRPRHGYAGALHFDPTSFRTFAPLDLAAMRRVWPGFRAFGHVKQFLNPTLYPQF